MRISEINQEPVIRVGLIGAAAEIPLALAGEFEAATGARLPAGDYAASRAGSGVRVAGPVELTGGELVLAPASPESSRFILKQITIGIDFHWQRHEAQAFSGDLILAPRADGVMAINRIPVEGYLASVISSEVSPASPPELLAAHAIMSRSWLLAQLATDSANESQSKVSDVSASRDDAEPRRQPIAETAGAECAARRPASVDRIVRWYTRESHADFDVCADDHCQRYQGVSKIQGAALDAILRTRGQVLTYEGSLCDARYCKSCGGFTELYRSAWEDLDPPYLEAVYDGPDAPRGYDLPLTVESNAARWIETSPPAFCRVTSADLLARVLPGFDQETKDHYRWRVEYSTEELTGIIQSRLGIDIGTIADIIPLERGPSGRIVLLEIAGSERRIVIGKELEIRRALSRSHLYSSAFTVEKTHAGFVLNGAGWGHGVGLCQIGAAAMADAGYSHQQILAHYFRGAGIEHLYD